MESISGAQPVRLFLVGLDEGLARSVARYVSADRRVALTGAVPSLALASILLSTTQIDLAILDWPVTGASPADALAILRLAQPGLRIACVTSEADAYDAAAARAGSDAVISRDEFAQGIESALDDLFPERFAGPVGATYSSITSGKHGD